MDTFKSRILRHCIYFLVSFSPFTKRLGMTGNSNLYSYHMWHATGEPFCSLLCCKVATRAVIASSKFFSLLGEDFRRAKAWIRKICLHENMGPTRTEEMHSGGRSSRGRITWLNKWMSELLYHVTDQSAWSAANKFKGTQGANIKHKTTRFELPLTTSQQWESHASEKCEFLNMTKQEVLQDVQYKYQINKVKDHIHNKDPTSTSCLAYFW